MHHHNSIGRLVVSFALLCAIATTAGAQVEYVVHVSVDGLGGPLFQSLLQADTTGVYANFQRFIDEGATTLNARTDFSHTNTLPNHTTMLTGRPVSMPAGQPNTTYHGYVNNGTPTPTATLHNSGNVNVSYIASVFDVAHDHGLTTGLYVSKSKFIIFEQSFNATNGAADTTPPDNGTDKIDTYLYLVTGSPSNASTLHAAFIADLSTAPAKYTFVHYRDPDSAGHSFSWGSPAYRTAVAQVNGYLGELFQTIENSATLKDHTVIILSSDHGGLGFGHSTPTLETSYRIPFFTWGITVDSGVDLYAANAGRRADPGTARPDYNVSPGPIRNGDSGNLALMLLGLPAVPGSSINSAQDLRLRDNVAVEPTTMSAAKSLFR
jgi:hypothetical protein